MGNPLDILKDPFNLFFYGPIYNLLMLIYEFIHLILPVGAFAAAIIVLTLLLRCCMIPLTRKQLKSSREMQVLQPKLKELQAQYRNNPQELMAAQRALYKEHGVSPMSGCLPLLIQMPFLYALYGAFRTVLPQSSTETAAHRLAHINGDLYPFVPHLQKLPEIGFLWANLGTPDPLHILPIVAAILTFIQLRMAMPVRAKPAPGTAAQPDPTTQATGMMQYIMPFFTLFIGWTFPAGLALYWCVSTGFSAVQQYFISGWGSLFVGVPGMEHLVPEPKQLPTLPARTPATARALTAGTVAAQAAQPASGGGLRGMLRQMRETMAAAQTQAAQQAQQKAEERANAAPQSRAQAPITRAEPPAPRRPRPSREGPMLIKPTVQASSELPENAIARDATGGGPEVSGELPEQTIKRVASGDGANGANGANGMSNGAGSSANGMNGAGKATGSKVNGTSGANKANGTGGASGAKRTASGAGGASARPGSTGQRKASGNKNMNAPRPRGGRPKGGR